MRKHAFHAVLSVFRTSTPPLVHACSRLDVVIVLPAESAPVHFDEAGEVVERARAVPAARAVRLRQLRLRDGALTVRRRRRSCACGGRS